MQGRRDLLAPFDEEVVLNPNCLTQTQYYCRKGVKEIYDTLISNQDKEEFHNISLTGAPESGKSCLVTAAAEHIASNGEVVLWAARREHRANWSVRVFVNGTVYSLNQYTACLEEVLQMQTSILRFLSAMRRLW